MVLEHAILPVIPGREAEFEEAFAAASVIISSAVGFIDLSLSRSAESPSQYLLLVHWESVAAHDPGFRGSPAYQDWKRLLHHFYDPFPVVGHFTAVHSAGPNAS